MADLVAEHPQPSLETKRLRLRPFTPADAAEVQRLAGDPLVAATTLTIPHPYPNGAAEEWIASHGSGWASGRKAVYAVTMAEGRLVGAVSLALTPAHASAELGYWIAAGAWGRGYATEAAAALCGYAFDALSVHRIEARHFLHNPASGRVMEKLGMRHEGVLRGAMRKAGRFEDLALYAVIIDDWRRAPPATAAVSGLDMEGSTNIEWTAAFPYLPRINCPPRITAHRGF